MAIKGSVPNGALPVLQILSFLVPIKRNFKESKIAAQRLENELVFRISFTSWAHLTRNSRFHLQRASNHRKRPQKQGND